VSAPPARPHAQSASGPSLGKFLVALTVPCEAPICRHPIAPQCGSGKQSCQSWRGSRLWWPCDEVFWLKWEEVEAAARWLDAGQLAEDYRRAIAERHETWRRVQGVTPPVALPLIAVAGRVVRINRPCGATICHHGDLGQLGFVEVDVRRHGYQGGAVQGLVIHPQ